MAKKFLGVNPATGKNMFEYSNDDPELQQKIQTGVAKPVAPKMAQSNLPYYPDAGSSDNFGLQTDSSQGLPSYPTEPSKPLDVGSALGSLGSGALWLGQKATDILVPRTKAVLQEAINPDTGAFGYGAPDVRAVHQRLFNETPEETAQKSKGNIGATLQRLLPTMGETAYRMTRTIPAAAELASYPISGAGFKGLQGASVATKLLQPAMYSGAAGLLHGLTTPSEMTLPERIGKGSVEGLTSAGTAAALSGVMNVLAPAIASKLKDVGTGIGRRIIRPETAGAQNMNWAGAEKKATETMLEKTGGAVTPEGIATKAKELNDKVARSIVERLQENPALANVDDVQSALEKAYAEAGLTEKGLRGQSNPLIAKAMDDVKQMINARIEPLMVSNKITPRVADAATKLTSDLGDEAVSMMEKVSKPVTSLPVPEIDKTVAQATKLADKAENQLFQLRAKLDAGAITQKEYTSKADPIKKLADNMGKIIQKADQARQARLDLVLKESAQKATQASGETATGAIFPPTTMTAPIETPQPMQITPQNLFEIKQKLGSQLDSAGVWDKIRGMKQGGAGITPDEQTKVKAYFAIRDMVDQMNPGTSYLTQLQSRLHDISQGAFNAEHPIGSRNFISSATSAVTQPLFMALAKGLNKIGNVGIPGTENDILRALATILSTPKGQ